MKTNQKEAKKLILKEHIIRPELDQKASKRSFQIRRALEDRKEEKRLSEIFGEEYWESI